MYSKCKTVQRTVVRGNWKDNRQSDNYIVLKKVGNATGGKVVACDDIFGRNLFNTQ